MFPLLIDAVGAAVTVAYRALLGADYDRPIRERANTPALAVGTRYFHRDGYRELDADGMWTWHDHPQK